jgi:sarcosine oxidase gamma subunit
VKDRRHALIEVVADFVISAQGLAQAKAILRTAYPLAIERDAWPIGQDRSTVLTEIEQAFEMRS